MDRIIVLDHGKIVEEGNHDQLMAKGGMYADLYNTYFRHQSLEYIEKMKETVWNADLEKKNKKIRNLIILKLTLLILHGLQIAEF